MLYQTHYTSNNPKTPVVEEPQTIQEPVDTLETPIEYTFSNPEYFETSQEELAELPEYQELEKLIDEYFVDPRVDGRQI